MRETNITSDLDRSKNSENHNTPFYTIVVYDNNNAQDKKQFKCEGASDDPELADLLKKASSNGITWQPSM